MLPVPLRESSLASVFRAELKNTGYNLTMPHHNGIGFWALPCTLCSCSMLLGTMSTCPISLVFSESSCLFSLVLNINSIFFSTYSIVCQDSTQSVVIALLELLYMICHFFLHLITLS